MEKKPGDQSGSPEEDAVQISTGTDKSRNNAAGNIDMDEVKYGRNVLVTHRGKLVAILRPIGLSAGSEIELASSSTFVRDICELAERVRRGVPLIIEREDQLIAIFPQATKEIRKMSKAVRARDEALMDNVPEFKTITGGDLMLHRGLVFNQVRKGAKFLIIKRGRVAAQVIPYNDKWHQSLNAEIVSAMEFVLRRGQFLKRVRNGERFIIQRRKTKIALLAPPPPNPKNLNELSNDERAKLSLVEGLTVDEVRKAATIMNGLNDDDLEKLSLVEGLAVDEVRKAAAIIKGEIRIIDLIK